jgi:PTH1 family peptidyl-tRNA hydrolase
MKLIVGLGNPGEKYAGNRHNIGFMAVDEMARGYTFAPWKKRFQGLAAEGQIGVEKCILLKPATYMNESGRSVGEAMRFYKLSVGNVIVVHDELDLQPGTVRVKTGGGNAGHNGLKSISAHIGNEYVRVRLGIGHPGDKALVANYVLQDFAKADRQWLEPFIDGIARGMGRLVEGGEAAFLSEAARGRPVSEAALKLNGATPPAIGAQVPLERPTSKPIEAMPMIKVPVFASRDAGAGGAVSRAVMMPEPDRKTPVAADVAPQPRPVIPPQPSHAPEAEPAPIQAEIEAAPADPMKPDMPSSAKAAPAAAAPRKKQGFLSWWFHKRIRGGVHQ